MATTSTDPELGRENSVPWWLTEPPADLHPDYDPDPVDALDEFSAEDRDYFADIEADRYERSLDDRWS